MPCKAEPEFGGGAWSCSWAMGTNMVLRQLLTSLTSQGNSVLLAGAEGVLLVKYQNRSCAVCLSSSLLRFVSPPSKG